MTAAIRATWTDSPSMPWSGHGREVISSRANPAIKAIRRLAVRQEREQTGLAYVEGVRLVCEALDQEADMRTLVVASGVRQSAFAQEVIRRARQRLVPSLLVTPEVFGSLAYKDECAQGLAAVVAQRWETLDSARPDAGTCWAALESVQYPGNLGTILRTCDAVGAAGVILLGRSTDPYDAASVRASLGSIFSQRLVRADVTAFAAWALRHGCTLVGASPDAADSYRAIAYRRPTVLVLGNERAGLSAELAGLCTARVRIPMVGRCDSLNLATAASLMLYAAFEQQRNGR